MMKRFIKITALTIVGLTLIITILEMSSSYKVTRTIHEDAPVITRLQVVVDAPVETVWKVFADVNNWSQWQKEISESKIEGPFQVGTSFNWKTHGLTIRSTFHTVDVNNEVGWSGPALGAFAIHNWHFIRQGNHTVVKVEESIRLVGLVAEKPLSDSKQGLSQLLVNGFKNSF
ncbi:SRPBCC family protein [Pedobacter sp. NJ-S-72]